MNNPVNNDTAQQITKIIAEKLSISPDRVTPHATLEDLGADSLDIVEIIMRLEEHFDIHIDDEAAEKLKNVGQVIAYVNELRKK